MLLPSNPSGASSFQEANTASSEFNMLNFLIWSVLSRVNTCTMVQVMTVTNSGTDIPAGFVDIMPLVNLVDGAGNVVPHGTIFKCPYFRLIGGTNAVILDPVAGDIGLACFADHDISSVIANQAQSNPGSWRRFDMSDGLYLGGFLGKANPTQFLQFSASGINVTSPATVTITAPNINLVGNVASTGTLTNNSKNVGSTHEHSGVTAGGNNTGVPV